MKTETLPNDDVAIVAPRSVPTLSTITVRFVTLLAVIVGLGLWTWSR